LRHPAHGLLENVRIFPPIDPVAKVIQVAVQGLYRDLMESAY